jgi:hypothetical protein
MVAGDGVPHIPQMAYFLLPGSYFSGANFSERRLCELRIQATGSAPMSGDLHHSAHALRRHFMLSLPPTARYRPRLVKHGTQTLAFCQLRGLVTEDSVAGF